jgi:Protein of unknown function (DUF3106)
MLGRVTIAGCLTALLLTCSFAQVQHSTPQHAAPNADGQWHRFGKEDRLKEDRPKQTRPNSSHSNGPLAPQNQPGHAGNWLRHYKDLPPTQQRRALESDPQFRRLTPQQQARLRNRLQHFSSLPPQQQQRVLNRMETWEHLTSDQKDRARQLFQQFKQLPPGRRQAVNRAIRDMRNLTPGQRDQLINSQPYMDSFSLQERVILSGAAHLPLAPGDGLQAAPPE